MLLFSYMVKTLCNHFPRLTSGKDDVHWEGVFLAANSRWMFEPLLRGILMSHYEAC